MLSGVQRAKTAWLHIKETPENFSKIIGILITAGHCDFVDVHRRKQKQVFRVFHPGAMDAFRGIAPIRLSVDPPEIIRVAMEFPRYQGGGERFTKVAGNECLSLNGQVLRLRRRRKVRVVLQGNL